MRRNHTPHPLLENTEWLRAQYATRSIKDIAREIGASAAVVRCQILRAGIELRARGVQLPDSYARRATDPIPRFWAKVLKTPWCWEWQGGRANGYGKFDATIHGHRVRSAHRFSWTLHYGAIPDDLWVLHKCDNPSCVNPDHLFLGTPKDNTDDMMSKGRKAITSKISPEQVNEIRHLSATMDQQAIADQFGISRPNVSMIVSGKTWR